MKNLYRMLQLLICVGLLTSLFACASTNKGKSTGQYVDDSVITTKVKTALFNEPSLKSFQINVKTYKAVVQLSGFVDSAKSVSKAGEVAKGVEGVASVENSLLVK
ncbi:MAG TPA: transporter [Deltaproteobacteria bacterium]|nr:transporter [Deltaproteobacteria bacterium]